MDVRVRQVFQKWVQTPSPYKVWVQGPLGNEICHLEVTEEVSPARLSSVPSSTNPGISNEELHRRMGLTVWEVHMGLVHLHLE